MLSMDKKRSRIGIILVFLLCLGSVLTAKTVQAAPRIHILTFAEVGEIKNATYTGELEGASEGLRIEVTGCGPLGRWDQSGHLWGNEYAFSKQYMRPGGLLVLTSGVNKLLEMRHNPKTVTLVTASKGSFTFQVPVVTVKTSGDFVLASGRSLGKDPLLYLGSDGRCYHDPAAKEPATD